MPGKMYRKPSHAGCLDCTLIQRLPLFFSEMGLDSIGVRRADLALRLVSGVFYDQASPRICRSGCGYEIVGRQG